MKIGLIVCDEPSEPLLSKHGDYPKFFGALLGPDHTIHSHHVYLGAPFPPPHLYDCLLITGSRQSVNDNVPWIQAALEWIAEHWRETGVPLVGVCFGHQLVGRAFGSVVAHCDWELGYTLVHMQDAGRAIFGGDMRINSIHKEQIMTAPPGFEIIGASDKCSNQGMVNRKKRIITLQGHPEVTADYIRDLAVLRHKGGIISDSVLQHVHDTHDLPIDNFGPALMDFIAQL
ncbi:hypothetical protein PSACC_02776 [Paramicrosporidium saccamoebae]|uniref:Glutamine amidotransferase domain-containing protein n=1 Tax=Paramicrosporidium saccamoebae TaxID=1246581 RepID=A0A2H9TI22_9FUNG|nr:hypothetical protein PSACC_02776 [Paramicrosporidium saccamoebae]